MSATEETIVSHKVKLYVEKRHPIKAIQIDRDNMEWIKNWIVSCAVFDERVDFGHRNISIVSKDGIVAGGYGDWVVQGVLGDFRIVRMDTFPLTYEEAQ